ncbi:hypothetical protein FACS189413_05670 [Bacteroidia bacterium]|nr:hypothetical protein FACS189413_05670 [Bacteroidia bacterium]
MNKLFSTLLLVLTTFSVQAQPFFIMESNREMDPTSISSDGNYVVGKVGLGTVLTGRNSFVWTKAGGLQEWDIDKINADSLGSCARGVSLNGRVVGVSPDPNTVVSDGIDPPTFFPYITGAFRDINAGEWTILPLPAQQPYYGLSNRANAVTDNGNIIVGGFSAGGLGQRWSAGYWDVSDPAHPVKRELLANTAGNDSELLAVSGNGKVMGGHENGNSRLWIYNENNSQYEKTPVTGSGGGEITAISQNGRYAVFADVEKGFRAVIYDIQKSLLINFDNNPLTGASGYSTPLGVSNDGIVVGYWGRAAVGPLQGSSETRRAFIYTKTLGMIELDTLLTDLGIDYQGVKLLAATGISADGRKIIGYGKKENKQVAFYVEIPEIATNWLPVQQERIESPAYGQIRLTWAKPETSGDATLVGYAVYAEDIRLTEITDPETLSYSIENVEDGTYHYTIRAIYQQEEDRIASIAGKILNITIGRKPFPFFDDFSDYQPGGPVLEVMEILEEIPLSTGYWDVSNNTVAFSNTWKASEFGYAHWCARFVTPGGSNYSESLTSPYFSTVGVEKVFLSFNIMVPAGTANDKVSVEIFDGSQWSPVEDILATGNNKWIYKTYDVSSLANKENVRFRFRAQGTSGTLQWIVDNVEFADSNHRMNTNPPLTISAREVPEEGTVHVNWSNPEGFVDLRYMWDDQVYQGAIANNQYPFIAANMYPAEDLKDYDGYYLTSISFWRTTNPNFSNLPAPSFRWFAAVGDERIVDEPVSDPQLKWNTVQLEHPVQIDVTKPLYYGVEVETCDLRDWPVGSATFYSTDTNGGKDMIVADGRGNIYSETNGLTWRTLKQDNPDMAFDLFSIRAVLAKDPEKTPQKNIRGYQLFRNDVAVYDQLFLGTSNLVTLNNYTDLNPLPAGQEACYSVRIYYTSQVWSENATACVTINSIPLTASENGLKVYPNHIRKGETLRVEAPQTSKSLQLQLFDLSGKKVQEVKIQSNVIDLPVNVNSGVYLLKVNGIETVKLIVK